MTVSTIFLRTVPGMKPGSNVAARRPLSYEQVEIPDVGTKPAISQRHGGTVSWRKRISLPHRPHAKPPSYRSDSSFWTLSRSVLQITDSALLRIPNLPIPWRIPRYCPLEGGNRARQCRARMTSGIRVSNAFRGGRWRLSGFCFSLALCSRGGDL